MCVYVPIGIIIKCSFHLCRFSWYEQIKFKICSAMRRHYICTKLWKMLQPMCQNDNPLVDSLFSATILNRCLIKHGLHKFPLSLMELWWIHFCMADQWLWHALHWQMIIIIISHYLSTNTSGPSLVIHLTQSSESAEQADFQLQVGDACWAATKKR